MVSRLIGTIVWTTACVMVAAAPQTPATTLRLGSLAPAGSPWDRALRNLSADWRQTSAGTVGVQIIRPLDSEATVLRRLEAGSLDAGAVTAFGLGGLDGAFNVFAIPFFYESDAELRAVLSAVEPRLRARLETKGLVLLQIVSAGWLHLFSRTPIRTVAELEDARIADVGLNPSIAAWYQGRGFQTASTALPDVFTRLETGRVTAVPATTFSALGFNWFRPAPHMQELRLAPLVVTLVVTARAWNPLPAATRARLLDEAIRAQIPFGVEVANQDRRSLAAMRTRGLRVTPPDVAALVVWRARAARWAAEARGELVPPEIYEVAVTGRERARRGR